MSEPFLAPHLAKMSAEELTRRLFHDGPPDEWRTYGGEVVDSESIERLVETDEGFRTFILRMVEEEAGVFSRILADESLASRNLGDVVGAWTGDHTVKEWAATMLAANMNFQHAVRARVAHARA
jgi:hypothetical protein